jgi:hypothetical protein
MAGNDDPGSVGGDGEVCPVAIKRAAKAFRIGCGVRVLVRVSAARLPGSACYDWAASCRNRRSAWAVVEGSADVEWMSL